MIPLVGFFDSLCVVDQYQRFILCARCHGVAPWVNALRELVTSTKFTMISDRVFKVLGIIDVHVYIFSPSCLAKFWISTVKDSESRRELELPTSPPFPLLPTFSYVLLVPFFFLKQKVGKMIPICAALSKHEGQDAQRIDGHQAATSWSMDFAFSYTC